MKIDCLEEIIGLSTSECPCLDVSGDIGTTASLSGQYMDNLQHGIPLQILGKGDCGEGSIWDKMVQARKDAINDFITQFLLQLSTHRNFGFDGYRGFIGEKSRKGNSRRTNLRDIVGTSIVPKRKYKGVQMCVTEICLGIDNDGDYDINIINALTLEVVSTHTITVTNKFGSITLNESLPLSDDRDQPITYAFVYDRKSANPMNYKFHCGCNSIPLPNWMSDGYLDAGSVSVKDINDIDYGQCSGTYSNGLLINFELKCRVLDYLCDVPASFWCDTTFGRVMAKALVLIANTKLVDSILNSQDINFYTLLGREALYGKRSHFSKLSNDLITALVTDLLPKEMQGCLTCDNSKTSGGFNKNEIIA